MSLSRSHKLGWIAFVSAMVGFLISEILGATTSTSFVIMTGIPVSIALLIGILGLDASGDLRNGKLVAIAIGAVLLMVATLMGIAAYVIHSSSDL